MSIDKDKEIQSFIQEVYNYFQMDFVYINSFLDEDETIWDYHFMSQFMVDKDYLRKLKESMLLSILQTYYHNIIGTAMVKKEVHIVDAELLKKFYSKEDPLSIFLNNLELSIVIHRFFINALEPYLDLKNNYYHFYRQDIKKILEIYNEIFEANNGNRIYEDPNISPQEAEQTYNNVHEALLPRILDYFDKNFRTENEMNGFINYLFSLIYAYCCYLKKEEGNLDAVEYAIMTAVDQNMNLKNVFGYNTEIACCLFDALASLYANYGEKYDMRKAVMDDRIQEHFRRLDSSYDVKQPQVIMFHEYSLDKMLESLLQIMHEVVDNSDIINLLTTDDSIYDFLLTSKLDARYETFYKNLLINKILGDVFEQKSYQYHVEKIADDLYLELKEIASIPEKKFSYFYEHGEDILAIYFDYHAKSFEYIKKVQNYLLTSDDYNFLVNIDFLASSRYIESDISLPSVKCINQMIDLLRKEVNLNKLLVGNSSDKVNKLFQTMCLSVYEHLLLEQNRTKEMDEILSLMEKEPQIIQYLQCHEEDLNTITNLFNYYNPSEVNNANELLMRSQIGQDKHIKILERLNPFNYEERQKKESN